MSQKLPNMLESTIQKIREMVDVNSVMGEPIHTPDGVTIIPVSKVSVGFGGGGTDFATSKNTENPFGGGVGGGVKVTPLGTLHPGEKCETNFRRGGGSVAVRRTAFACTGEGGFRRSRLCAGWGHRTGAF